MADMPEWMHADGVSLSDPFDPDRIVLAYVRQHRPDDTDPHGLAHDVWIVARGMATVPVADPEFWPTTERMLAAVLADVETRRPITARFPGWCLRCEEPVSPGDTIRASVDYPGSWEHADCDEARAARPERAVICTVCNEARPCDCDDLSPVWTTS